MKLALSCCNDMAFDNILLVNGEYLQADDPEFLREVLVDGREFILGAIEKLYNKYREIAPDIQRGSIWVARLSESRFDDITPEAMERHRTLQSNRYIFNRIGDLAIRVRPYWVVAEETGFIPEARPIHTNDKMSGLNLLVRDTELI